MKSCSSNGGAAYSRPVPALAGTTREVWMRNRRGGPMERCGDLHRFVLILCTSLFFAAALRGTAGPEALAHPQIQPAQATLPPQASAPPSLTALSMTAEQT